MVSVGTIIWLSSELMFFAGLFAMYFVARAQAHGNWPPEPTHLDMKLAVPVTCVLVASSFTCQMGVFAAEKGDVFGLRRWYVVTFFMGLIFVCGQGTEYHGLYSEGTSISSSVYGSVFFITTGFHGLHVIGGLIAFIFLLIRTKVSKFTRRRQRRRSSSRTTGTSSTSCGSGCSPRSTSCASPLSRTPRDIRHNSVPSTPKGL